MLQDGTTRDFSSKIREFLARNLLFNEAGFTYDDDASFMENGIIDSLGIIELVAFVESTFGIQVADDELIPENFDSVSRMNAYLRRKCEAGA
jgi:acyl carrier protein